MAKSKETITQEVYELFRLSNIKFFTPLDISVSLDIMLGDVNSAIVILQSEHNILFSDKGWTLSSFGKREPKLMSDKLKRLMATKTGIGADFSYENVTDANFSGSSLYGTNFRHADMKRCDMHNVGLEGSDLTNAILNETDLSWSSLFEVVLENTRLYNVNFSNSDLRRANLKNADLRHANLTNANLEDADLRGANLKDTILKNVNIRNVKLKDTIHSNQNEMLHELKRRYRWYHKFIRIDVEKR